jgi:hypothetical protein
MVSEVSVYGHMAMLLLGLRLKQNIMAGSLWWSRVDHLMTDRRQRDKAQTREQGKKYTLLRNTPSYLLPSTWLTSSHHMPIVHPAMSSSMF